MALRRRTVWLAALPALFVACRAEPTPAEQQVQRGKELLESRPDQALTQFEEAAKLNGPGAKKGMAAANEQLGNLAEAEKLLVEVLAAEPGDLEAKLALVRVRIELGKLDDARADLQGTLDRKPPHVPALLLFAAIAKSPGEAAAGMQALDALSDPAYRRFRESAEFAVARAALLSAKGAPADANAVFQAAASSRSMSPQLAVALSDSLKLVGRRREAEWLLERAAAEPSAPEVVNERLADVAMDLGHLASAEQAIGKLRTEFKPDPRALLLAARLYDLRNEKENSARASGRALEALPKDVSASERRRIVLAHADGLIRAGHHDQAEKLLRKLLENEPTFAVAKVVLGAVLLSLDKADEVVSLLTPLLAEPKLASQAYPVVIAAHRKQGKLDEAEKLSRDFLAMKPPSPRAAPLLAEVLASRNRGEEALSVIDKALQQRPADVQLVRSKLDLTQKVRGVPAVLEAAQRLGETTSDPAVALLTARVRGAYGQVEQAIGVLEALAAKYPSDTRIWADLSALQARAGRLEAAVESLQKLVALVPFDTSALIVLGSLQSKLGRVDDATKSYEAALEVEPNSVVPLNNLAALLTGRPGQERRAVELARKARAIASKDAAIADTLGWALVNTGEAADLAEGLELLKGSSKQIRVAEGYYHYGMALKRSGKSDEALAELQRALEKSSDFKGVAEVRAAVEELSRPAKP